MPFEVNLHTVSHLKALSSGIESLSSHWRGRTFLDTRPIWKVLILLHTEPIERFVLLLFVHVYMILDQKVLLKYLLFAGNQRKSVMNLKSQFLIKKSYFDCCICYKGPTLVLLDQVNFSVSRDGLQLKFYKLLVKLLRN